MSCGERASGRRLDAAIQHQVANHDPAGWCNGQGLSQHGSKGWWSFFTMTGLEAGPLSQWLYAGMAKTGLAVELIETRHVPTTLKTMPAKTEKKDAWRIAQLMRLGWFRPLHCNSLPARAMRALLTARKLIQGKLHDIEMSIRGILRGFGLKVRTDHNGARIRELIEGHPTLEAR